MKRTDIRRIIGATVSTAGLSLAGCVGANNQQGGSGGGMMGGGYGHGWMGGYGGPWMLFLIVAVAGLVAWFVARGRNKK